MSKKKHTRPEFIRLKIGRHDLEVYNDATDEKLDNVIGVYLTELVGNDIQAFGVTAIITRFKVHGYENDGKPHVVHFQENAIVTKMEGIAL